MSRVYPFVDESSVPAVIERYDIIRGEGGKAWQTVVKAAVGDEFDGRSTRVGKLKM